MLALKELQSDKSIVILPAGKGRSTVIFNCEDYLEKYVDHTNNGPYQLHKNRSYYQNKSKTLKQLKVLKGKKIIDNKLFCYVKSDSQARSLYMSYCFR